MPHKWRHHQHLLYGRANKVSWSKLKDSLTALNEIAADLVPNSGAPGRHDVLST